MSVVKYKSILRCNSLLVFDKVSNICVKFAWKFYQIKKSVGEKLIMSKPYESDWQENYWLLIINTHTQILGSLDVSELNAILHLHDAAVTKLERHQVYQTFIKTITLIRSTQINNQVMANRTID